MDNIDRAIIAVNGMVAIACLLMVLWCWIESSKTDQSQVEQVEPQNSVEIKLGKDRPALNIRPNIAEENGAISNVLGISVRPEIEGK